MRTPKLELRENFTRVKDLDTAEVGVLSDDLSSQIIVLYKAPKRIKTVFYFKKDYGITWEVA